MAAWRTLRPLMVSISNALSKQPESELASWMIGLSSSTLSPQRLERISFSRARIQFLLPRSVLISPLWAMVRNGCASFQFGKVLVE